MLNSSYEPTSAFTFVCPISRAKRRRQGLTILESLTELNDSDKNRLFAEKKWVYEYFVRVCEPNTTSYYVLHKEKEDITLLPFQLVIMPRSSLNRFLPNDRGKLITLRNKIARYFLDRTEVRLLVQGNQYLTNQHGILSTKGQLDCKLIEDAAKLIRKQTKYNAILVKDLPADSRYGLKRFARFEVDPDMVLKCDFNSFEDYLTAMRSKYRQRYNNCSRVSANIEEQELTHGQVLKAIPILHSLLTNVLKENRFNMADFSKQYLLYLSRLSNSRFFAYYQGEKIIGFRASLISPSGLIAHLVGYEENLNKSSKIYLRMLFDFVKEAYGQGQKQIFFGRTAIEIKSTLGATPRQLYLYLRPTYFILQKISQAILSRLKPTQYTIRSPFKTANGD